MLGGIEVMRALNDAGIATLRDIEVGFFTEEEGVRFGTDMLGSAVTAGRIPLEVARKLTDADDTTVSDELIRIGFDGDAHEQRPVPHAYIECHIEQGPILACATSRVRIGALVTPLSRRRVHKVARETVTLDWLSSGRLTFGAGLGSARNNELEPYGEVTDPRERADLLDQGLDALMRYWAGEFEPLPVQRPRPPVWVAGEWPACVQ